MHKFTLNSHAGFALLMFLVILMGVGGIVLVGYSQGILKQVEESKFQHNQRVLKEAKQVLLQFAYNYPVTNGNGPGRLPCPDTDNDGIPNTPINCSTFLGRLPWNQQNMNLYDIRDADGERLWYAVSSNFSTQEAASLNSHEFGTITLRDQSGNIIYDGSHPGDPAKYGVAAIIIAPGDITARNGVTQDRSVANADDPFDTTVDTDPGIINAANYLDRLVGTEDNANFTQDSPTDGFILGPVNIQSTNAINDQFIVITAAEVIEVAEKAVLQAYRTAINNYLTLTGNIYPWLYNYKVDTIAELDGLFPADSNFATELTLDLDNFGRIPSIFADYFTETDSQPIESELFVSMSANYPVTPTTVTSSFSGELEFNIGTTSHAFNFQSTDILTDVSFVNINAPADGQGRLTGTVVAPQSFPDEKYFWDDDDNPTGIWTECGDDGNGIPEVTDCNRTAAGVPDPGGSNDNKEEILRVVVTLDFTGVVNFDADYTTPVVPVTVAATGAAHASITGTFAAADVIVNSLPLTASYEIDRHYHPGAGELFTIEESGTLDIADLSSGPLTLGMRYYPELPDWAYDDSWHNSVMMSYALDYRPGNAPPCSEGADCIRINGFSGNNDNKISILTLAGQHDWTDQGADDYNNDLNDVFDPGNFDRNYIFEARAVPGNDKFLVIEECAIAACP